LPTRKREPMTFIPLLIKEAIATVALEHPTGCKCDICLANKGDEDAAHRVWLAINDSTEETT
jgi:hypothetical protein